MCRFLFGTVKGTFLQVLDKDFRFWVIFFSFFFFSSFLAGNQHTLICGVDQTTTNTGRHDRE